MPKGSVTSIKMTPGATENKESVVEIHNGSVKNSVADSRKSTIAGSEISNEEVRLLIDLENCINLEAGDASVTDDSQSQELIEKNALHLASTQQNLESIHKNIKTMLKAMRHDSHISRAADLWGELAAWKKIALGGTLTLPTLAAGIIAHVGVLFVVSGFTMFTYFLGGAILTDHHTWRNLIKDAETHMISLSDMLSGVIKELAKIGDRINRQVNRLADHNSEYKKLLDIHTKQSIHLETQVKSLQGTESALRTRNNELVVQIKTIRVEREEDKLLLNKHQQELSKVKKEYAQNQEALASTTKELQDVRSSFQGQVDQLKANSAIFKGVLTDITEAMDADQEDKKLFREKLAEFVKDKGADLQAFTTRICTAEKELFRVKDQYEAANDRYNQLLESHKILLDWQARLCEELKESKSAVSLLEEVQKSLPASSPSNTNDSNPKSDNQLKAEQTTTSRVNDNVTPGQFGIFAGSKTQETPGIPDKSDSKIKNDETSEPQLSTAI
ncbi:MAG: hypothetical protein H2069_06780 [Legionella sp.]|nr:hypothetical protein [Legionella sp.]